MESQLPPNQGVEQWVLPRGRQVPWEEGMIPFGGIRSRVREKFLEGALKFEPVSQEWRDRVVELLTAEWPESPWGFAKR